ncbi:NAD(P)/FAD-dependent oxidoreductase [Streptomyces ipomoeae]|uniref:NAD(P)/FAD-dependent oxidoreductase n=1 Tax=Streptomyces ipomoeae TaxID=103232 RepID=UPI0011475807|nr:FAD-dependent oxidoreductase [Streptomyces ipomoeae]MDX2937788.1 FAD-dependent oxidoreductase [Streptomyces ipomoeae]TQE17207.1 hypothetical protein SipoB123_37145 [Streptomyces ipomoeae]
MDRAVIVGAGAAGTAAAGTLREEGFDGTVTVIGAESWAPYARPAVSKQLLTGEFTPDQARLRPPEWYGERGIELLLGEAATAIDPQHRTVRLAGGETLPYDTLLLATGGVPRPLTVAGVRHEVPALRSVDDALRLRDLAAAHGEVTIVGGGFIGLEAAARLVTAGVRVRVLEAREQPMQRVLGPELGSWFADVHRAHGVEVRTGAHIVEMTGRAGEWWILLADGSEVTTPVVLAGVGMAPATELAERAGCAVADGVVVDEYCRTSVPGVFAAGDMAVHPDAFLGTTVRIEHWQHAQRHGASAARNMLGLDRAHSELPWFWSEQYDVNLQMIGYPAPAAATVDRGSTEARSFVRFSVVDGVLHGAVGVNRARDIRDTRALMARRVPIDPRLLRDEAIGLPATVRAARNKHM